MTLSQQDPVKMRDWLENASADDISQADWAGYPADLDESDDEPMELD
jgi:hypothetical protein